MKHFQGDAGNITGTASGFPAILKRVLIQPVSLISNGNIVTKSMLQVIEGKRALEKQDYEWGDFFRVEQFIFQRIKGQWMFTRAYLEE